jgi:hypothetical protein
MRDTRPLVRFFEYIDILINTIAFVESSGQRTLAWGTGFLGWLAFMNVRAKLPTWQQLAKS